MSYNASLHVTVNKALGPAGRFPTDARSYFYDEVLFLYRPYASTAEVISYLNSSLYRSGNFSIFISIGGSIAEYWFQDNTTDAGLVPKGTNYTLPVATPTALGGFLSGGTGYTIDVDGRLEVTGGGGGGGSTSFLSMPTTGNLGILTTGTDQTAALNTILANASYKGIVVDFTGGGAITISGTVNCQGKMIYFLPGSYFTGSGILSNAVLTPMSYRQKCFDVSIVLSNCSCGWQYFSAMWYGAIGDNLTDNAPIFQKCSDILVLNAATLPKYLFIPPAGNYYKINKGVLSYNFSGNVYQQITIMVIGQENAQSSTLSGQTRIRKTFSDGFGWGFQHANGGCFRGISMEGPLTTGISQITFLGSTFTDIFPTARDTQYSPDCGVCIDPFRGIIPSDGGYPGWTAFYQGNDAISGTTDFFVQECHITGNTVGVMWSPNGKTQQGEDCKVIDCEIVIANVAISWGQAQSDKSCVWDTRHWYYVWTVIDTFTYGQGPSSLGGTIEEIDGMNIAGFVKRLFNIKMVEKHCSMRNVYCESLYEFGIVRSDYNKIILEGCTFIYAEVPLRPQFHMQVKNVEFHSCLNKIYDDLYTKRTIIDNLGGSMFQNCMFDQAPMVINPFDDVGQVEYINCTCFTPEITPCVIGSGNYSAKLSTPGVMPALYGNFKMQDFTGLDSSDHNSNGASILPDATVTYSYSCATFDRYVRSIATAVTLTIDATARTASFTSSLVAQCKVNDYCIDHATGFNLGRITSIVSTTITISEIPVNISSGTFTIDLVYWICTQRPFMGDITSGSASVSNIVPVLDGAHLTVNSRIDNPAFVLGTYVVSYNNTTKVATMSTNALITKTRMDFANGNPETLIVSTRPPTAGTYNAFAFGILSGAVWVELPSTTSSAKSPVTWLFNIGGTTSGTAYYGNKADYNIQYNYRLNAGALEYYDPYAGSWTAV